MIHVQSDRPRRAHHVYLEGAPQPGATTSGPAMALGRPPEPGRALVVGTGLIGGSIGLRLRHGGWHVTGRDADPVCRQGPGAGGARRRRRRSRGRRHVRGHPVDAVADEARRALATTTGVVTDVGGVKASIVDAVADARFVGGHPMAGSEQEVEGAAAELFEGATWVLTPTEGTDASAFAGVRQIVGTLGPRSSPCRPTGTMSWWRWCRVPHLAAATLMRLADERSEEHRALLRLAGGGRDMTRIASGHPGIWPDICADNRVAIVDVLDDLRAALGEMRDLVAEPGRAADRLDKARRRVSLPARFRTAADLREVRIPVPDRPGVVADVAILAADLDVNIVDLEIAHSTEGPQGVLVLIESGAVEVFRAGLVGGGATGRPCCRSTSADMTERSEESAARPAGRADQPRRRHGVGAGVEEPHQPGAAVRRPGRGDLHDRQRPRGRRLPGHARPSPPSALASRWTMGTKWPPGPS